MTQITATYLDHMGSDLTTVNAARVSFGKKSEVFSPGDAKLVNYLAKHKHLSPFGHAFASFHVKAPIFVARQLVKHKFLRWNEVSRRYVNEEPEFYTPDVWRGRAKDKKQGSDGVVNLAEFSAIGGDFNGYFGEGTLAERLACKTEDDAELYNLLIKAGASPEQARVVLPQSLMTEWHHSGSLDAWASLCNLRCTNDTQHETRLVADQIDSIMGGLFPVSWRALRGKT